MVYIQKAKGVALVALGGNLPEAGLGMRETLLSALNMLSAKGLALTAVSRFFATPAFPAGSGPDYVNAAAAFETDWPAEAILEALHQVESALGRTRSSRWAARSIDLDLLALGEQIAPDSVGQKAWMDLPAELQARQAPTELILPHPRLSERAFVLIPLSDVAPMWRHPVLGKTVHEMLAALSEGEKAAIHPIDA